MKWRRREDLKTKIREKNVFISEVLFIDKKINLVKVVA